jgi:hypothetical protein
MNRVKLLVMILIISFGFSSVMAQDPEKGFSIVGFWSKASNSQNGWLFGEDGMGIFVEQNSGTEPLKFQYKVNDGLLYIYHPNTTNVLQILLANEQFLVLRDLAGLGVFTLLSSNTSYETIAIKQDALIGAWSMTEENVRLEFDGIDQVNLGMYTPDGVETLGVATYSIKDEIVNLHTSEGIAEIKAYFITPEVIIGELHDVTNSSTNDLILVRELGQLPDTFDLSGIWHTIVPQGKDSSIGFRTSHQGLAEFSEDGQVTASVPDTITGIYKLDSETLSISRNAKHAQNHYADQLELEYQLLYIAEDIVFASSVDAPQWSFTLLKWQNLPTLSENISMVDTWVRNSGYVRYHENGTKEYRNLEDLDYQSGGTYEVAGRSLVTSYEALENQFTTSVYTIERLDTFFLILSDENSIEVYSRFQE